MMVNRYACDDCETEVDYLSREGAIYCECGEELDFVGKVGCVRGLSEGQTPVGVLEELLGRWREMARMGTEPGKTETFIARSETYGQCADALEERIELSDSRTNLDGDGDG